MIKINHDPSSWQPWGRFIKFILGLTKYLWSNCDPIPSWWSHLITLTSLQRGLLHPFLLILANMSHSPISYATIWKGSSSQILSQPKLAHNSKMLSKPWLISRIVKYFHFTIEIHSIHEILRDKWFPTRQNISLNRIPNQTLHTLIHQCSSKPLPQS